MATKPDPYTAITQGRFYRPTDGKGRFEYYTGSFKDAILSAGEPGSPFSDALIGGDRSWSSPSYVGTNNRILLDETWSDSGRIYFKMAPGFQGLFYAITQNNDYFYDAATESIDSDWDTDQTNLENLAEIYKDLEDEWPTVWVQADYAGESRTVIGLDSGDYISIDVDDNSNKIAQMRARIGGVDYFSNDEISEETWVSKIWIRKWNPDYVWPIEIPQDEVQGPLQEPGSGGDLDGDGVIDDEDPDPYDPDIQEPGDVDDDPPLSPGITCPPGSTLVDGICVPDGGGGGGSPPEPAYDPAEDVSALGMILVLAAIGGIVYLAIKTRSGSEI